jgi:cell division initiation protein
MGYTPVELRHVRVARRPLGYDRASVERVLEEVAESFETVWRDRGELGDKVELLEAEVEELKRREQVLTNTLVAAERAAEEVRHKAKLDADVILSEAHGEARSIVREAHTERERLFVEVRRIESLLRSALGAIEEASPRPVPAVESAPPGPPPAVARLEAAPARRDTERDETPAAPSPEEPEASTAEEADPKRPWPQLKRVAKLGGSDLDWGD